MPRLFRRASEPSECLRCRKASYFTLAVYCRVELQGTGRRRSFDRIGQVCEDCFLGLPGTKGVYG